MSSISAEVRPYVKEVLLALCFLSALPAIVNRSADIVGAVPHTGYLVLLIILWGGLLGAAYTSPAFLRWTTAFLLAGTAYYMIVFERVTTEEHLRAYADINSRAYGFPLEDGRDGLAG